MNRQVYWLSSLFLLLSVICIAFRYPGNLPPWLYVYNDEFRLWKPVALMDLGSEYYGRLRPLHFLLTDMMFAAGYLGLVPGKMVSWLAALLTVIFLLAHGLQIKNTLSTATAPILLSVIPLFIYFGVVGVPDILVGLCLLWAAIAWEHAENWQRRVWYVLAGSFVGLALLSKEQSLFYLVPLGLGLIRPLLKRPQVYWPYLNATFDARYALALLGASIVFLPFALFVAAQAPFPYVATWGRQFIMATASASERLDKLILSMRLMPLWLGWPLLVLVAIGLVKGLKSWRSLLNAFGLIGIVMFLFIPGPNYLVPLLPWLSLIASNGLELLTNWIKRPVTRCVSLVALVLLICLGQTSSALMAHWASRDTFFQDTVERLRQLGFPATSAWLFSNYWPVTFTFALGYGNATWLTTDEHDAHIFEVSGLTIKAIEQEPLPAMPLEVLQTQGGIVVIMWPRLDDLLAKEPPYRLQATQFIQRCSQPVWVLNTRPRFPISSNTSQILIYRIEPGQLRKSCP